MNKLEKIKSKFRWIDNEPDLFSYGQFTNGLSSKEIEEYIQARSNKLNVKKLIKNLYEIMGHNTATLVTCEMCNQTQTLLYRHDVKRFSDILFGKTNSTYFD